MIEVPLSRSDKKAIVDDCFREEVTCQKWGLSGAGYAQTTVKHEVDPGRRKHLFLHLLIMGEKPGYEVDHINGNRLDNRMDNLRHVTKAQQQWNRGHSRLARSGHTGVTLHGNKWQSTIRVNRKQHYLGSFSTLEEAMGARNKAEEEFYGEFSKRRKVNE